MPPASPGTQRLALLIVLLAAAGCEEPGVTRPSGPPAYTRFFCIDTAIAIGVGETAVSGAGAAGCDLKPAAGAEYALAYLDTRAIASAQVARETTFADYSVSLRVARAGPAAVGAPARVVRFTAASLPESDVFDVSRSDQTSQSWPTQWARPWWLGERFELYDPFADSSVFLRVQRIYVGCCVVAWTEGGDTLRLTRFLPQLDSAFDVVWTYGVPLMRRVFADTLPISSTGAGQYLIILRDTITSEGQAFLGQMWIMRAPGPTLTWTYLSDGAYPNYVALASTVAHEMAHSYQYLALNAGVWGEAQNQSRGGSFWGREGGANLVSYEMTRRYGGIALDANYDWRHPGPGAAERRFAERAQPGDGQFTDGYDNAMGFLRDLVLRRMQAGEPINWAVRAVSLGAIEGWYGYDGVWQREGLTARMRQQLGDAWNPSDALLQWALSHAADDLTPSPVFQDRASLRIWDLPVGQYGWRADTTLSTPSGAAILITRRYGSPGFSYVLDDGAGLSLRISSPDATIAWQLVRIR